MDLVQLSAVQAAAAIRAGQISAEALTRACLERIAEREDAVQAWTFLDPDYALQQARLADLAQREGRALGPLHGVPVGVKDIFDTKDMPTANGSVLHAGRQPVADASAVSLLRAAGAVIMGKTVTTEFAMYTPGKTRNPLDPERTPGGSSSGSAAAVAASMVPLAIGSQTNGSVIRPAAYCGVVGFKPSHGLIPRYRTLLLSRVLDHVGVFARTVEDAALIAEALVGYDERDPDSHPAARPMLVETARETPPVRPRLGFVKSSVWDQAEAPTQAAFAELIDVLGADVEALDLPAEFDDAVRWHTTLMEADEALNLGSEYEHGRDRLSERLRGIIERGREVRAVDYLQALAGRERLASELAALLERYDALLTPATTGVAPRGLEATGSPIFCTLWTLCGVPAITVPLLTGEGSLPLGVQLIAACGDDARLLRTARWLLLRAGE